MVRLCQYFRFLPVEYFVGIQRSLRFLAIEIELSFHISQRYWKLPPGVLVKPVTPGNEAVTIAPLELNV
jgi:hypothetical protein